MTVDFASARWRKSGRSSGEENSTCVEIAVARWRKSARSSGEENSECVEVADLGRVVGIRDSKDRDGPKLVLSPATWRALTHQLKRG